MASEGRARARASPFDGAIVDDFEKARAPRRGGRHASQILRKGVLSDQLVRTNRMTRTRSTSPAGAKAQKPSPAGRTPTWKLEDAKAKFSEVVRRAHDHGPQYITVRGKPTVAIVDIAELE